MKRVQKIFEHPLYQIYMKKNQEYEKERIYCKHGIEHLMDVARLGYIFALERKYEIAKDMIYAAALLHDCGRWKQYEDQTPHNLAGAELSVRILVDAGYTESEIEMICDAIREHRGENEASKLSEILYDADKMSRNCFACREESTCNWSAQKKNMKIMW